MKLTKLLILALMINAAVVFVMQICRTPVAWVGVSLYWLILTIKNFVDWKRNGR